MRCSRVDFTQRGDKGGLDKEGGVVLFGSFNVGVGSSVAEV